MARVLVVGPGAIGTLIAARLAEAGHQVTVACRTQGTASAIDEGGLHATGPEGHIVEARVDTMVRPRRLDVDAVIIATKGAAAIAAGTAWARVTGQAPVVALQNGILGDDLAPLLGTRLVECTVAFPATLEGPGRSVQTGPGRFFVGAWPTGTGPHAQGVAAILGDACPTSVSENMLGVKWTKLLINASASTLSALTGQPLGEVLRQRPARQAFRAIVAEGIAVGRAARVRFEPVLGFRPALFSGIGALAGAAGQDAIIRVVGRKYRRMRSSSLQDVGRGRKTEVDALNGYLVAEGRRVGVATPVNQRVTEAIHAIEAGRARPGPCLVAKVLG